MEQRSHNDPLAQFIHLLEGLTRLFGPPLHLAGQQRLPVALAVAILTFQLFFCRSPPAAARTSRDDLENWETGLQVRRWRSRLLACGRRL